MRIKKLELHNFRCFENYELELADRFTLLIGDNGSGKTAVLDALAVAAGDLLNIPEVNQSSIKTSFRDDDMRVTTQIMGQTLIRERAEISSISASYVLKALLKKDSLNKI